MNKGKKKRTADVGRDPRGEAARPEPGPLQLVAGQQAATFFFSAGRTTVLIVAHVGTEITLEHSTAEAACSLAEPRWRMNFCRVTAGRHFSYHLCLKLFGHHHA